MLKIKGWKTVLFNALIAGSIPALQSMLDFNWVEAVGPTWSVVAVAAVNFALRFVTDSPVFKSR